MEPAVKHTNPPAPSLTPSHSPAACRLPWREVLPTLLLVLATGSCGGAQRSAVDQGAWRQQSAAQSSAMPQAMAAQEMASQRARRYRVTEAQQLDRASAPSSRPPSAAPRPGGRPAPTKSAGTGHANGKVAKVSNLSFGGAAVDGQLSGAAAGKGEPADQAEVPKEEAAMVVYLGYLNLRVKRRLEAVDRITQLTEKAGGYIERLGQQVIVVRIPATDFETVMRDFAEVGEVLDRRVKALDVSQQFTDLDARLAVARRSRQRLLSLLEQVEDVEERLRILHEIKRLSEVIEGVESTLGTLRNLASYFTITIELQAISTGQQRVTHRSPFPWVRALTAHRVTITDGRRHVQMQMPKGFVLFDADDDFRAQAADTSMLRAGRLDNEPRGDAPWWARAVDHEMEGRDEAVVAKGTAGGLVYRVYRNKDLQPRYWLVALHTRGEDLYVLEVFFPHADAWERHREGVLAALATFGVK